MRRLSLRLSRLEQDQTTREDPRIEYLQRVAGKSRYQALSDLAEIFRIYLSRPDTTSEGRILLKQAPEKAKRYMAEEKLRQAQSQSLSRGS